MGRRQKTSNQALKLSQDMERQGSNDEEEMYAPLPEGTTFDGEFLKQEVKDGIQIAMQLTWFDNKMGPRPVLIIGSPGFLNNISEDVIHATARELDNLKEGEISGSIKHGFSKLLMSFQVNNEDTRGGKNMFLLTIYFPEDAYLTGEIRDLVYELLRTLEVDWTGDATLLENILRKQAPLTWARILTELRVSIWNLLNKLAKAAPVQESSLVHEKPLGVSINLDIPDVDDIHSSLLEETIAIASEQDGFDDEIASIKNEIKEQEETNPITRLLKQDGDEDDEMFNEPFTGVTVLNEGSKVQLLQSAGKKNPPSQKVTKEMLSDKDIVEIAGKFQLKGYTIRVNKKTGAMSAFKAVNLDVNSPGLVGLLLAFDIKVLKHSIINVIDDNFFGNDAPLKLNGPEIDVQEMLKRHIPDMRRYYVNGETIGRIFKEQPLKVIYIPIQFVHGDIIDNGDKRPFYWREPGAKGQRLYVVSQSSIDMFDAFILKCLACLGDEICTTERKNFEKGLSIIKNKERQDKIISITSIITGAFALLAAFQVFPIQTSVAIIKNYYYLVVPMLAYIGTWFWVKKKTKTRLDSLMDEIGSAVYPGTPFFHETAWDEISNMAQSMGPKIFPLFKQAFCSHLDTNVLDESAAEIFKKLEKYKKSVIKGEAGEQEATTPDREEGTRAAPNSFEDNLENDYLNLDIDPLRVVKTSNGGQN
ncbi:MAG: hypothetical protein ACFFCS_01780 [Candidatus Hodarchaeota archaeon]